MSDDLSIMYRQLIWASVIYPDLMHHLCQRSSSPCHWWPPSADSVLTPSSFTTGTTNSDQPGTTLLLTEEHRPHSGFLCLGGSTGLDGHPNGGGSSSNTNIHFFNVVCSGPPPGPLGRFSCTFLVLRPLMPSTSPEHPSPGLFNGQYLPSLPGCPACSLQSRSPAPPLPTPP